MIFRSHKTSDIAYNKSISEKIGVVLYNDFLGDTDVFILNTVLNRIPYKKYMTKKYINFGYNFVYNKTATANLNKIDDIPFEFDIFKGKNNDINQLNIDVIDDSCGFTKVSNRDYFDGPVFIYNIGAPLYITFTNIKTHATYMLMIQDNTLVALSEVFRNNYTYHMSPRKLFKFNNRKHTRNGKSFLFTYRRLSDVNLDLL